MNGMWISELEASARYPRTIDRKVGTKTVMCEVVVQTEPKTVTERRVTVLYKLTLFYPLIVK